MKKLRGAVIGCGFISSNGHFPAFAARAKSQNDVEIVAAADFSPERLQRLKELSPNIRTYTSAEALIDAEWKNLDFVDIAVPPADHAAITFYALEKGLHVLCEKPLAPTAAIARAMAEKAALSQRVLFPVHNYKHAPVVKAVREIIQSGRIGKIRAASLSTFRNIHAKGVKEWKPDWRRHHAISGGGIGMDHGSHSFYLLFEWLGTLPTSISATTLNHSNGKYDTEDLFSAFVKFPSGHAQINLTWNAGVRKVLYTLQGERGAITIDDDQLELAVLQDAQLFDGRETAANWVIEKKTIESDWMDASHVTWFNSLFDQFKQAIESNDYINAELKTACECINVIEHAYQSARSRSEETPLRTLEWNTRKTSLQTANAPAPEMTT